MSGLNLVSSMVHHWDSPRAPSSAMTMGTTKVLWMAPNLVPRKEKSRGSWTAWSLAPSMETLMVEWTAPSSVRRKEHWRVSWMALRTVGWTDLDWRMA